jgi:hypothetical protein
MTTAGVAQGHASTAQFAARSGCLGSGRSEFHAGQANEVAVFLVPDKPRVKPFPESSHGSHGPNGDRFEPIVETDHLQPFPRPGTRAFADGARNDDLVLWTHSNGVHGVSFPHNRKQVGGCASTCFFGSIVTVGHYCPVKMPGRYC